MKKEGDLGGVSAVGLYHYWWRGSMDTQTVAAVISSPKGVGVKLLRFHTFTNGS